MTPRLARILALALVAAATPAAGQRHKRVPPPSAAREYQPNVQEYTVVQGDTLWDITTRVLGSPWFWPRVWSYNPEITNPHWIYPGDVVRFQPSGQPLPRLAQLAAAPREMPPEQPAPEVQEAPREPEAGPVIQEVQAMPPPPVQARRVRRLVNLLLSPRELAESGTLTNSIADKLLLSPSDEVFLTFPPGRPPSPGQRYMIYRTVEEVTHPITHDEVGYITQITGFATVRAGGGDLSRAVVTEALSEIERGQMVAPMAQLPLVDQQPTNARVTLSGYIVAVEPGPSVVGERQVVFIDIGQGRGLEPGNRLAVYVDEDPVQPGRKLPLTPIALLMAVDVRQTATTCVIIDSRQEVVAGLAVKTLLH